MRLWKFALPVVVLATGVTPAQGVSDQTVSYHGYQVTVPASWPVVDLTKDPTACVRYDRPAVYLGSSTAQADCPAHLVGRSEGIVLAPLTKPARSTDGELQVAAHDAGVLATAYYAPGGEQTARNLLSTGRVMSKSASIAQPKAQAATPSVVATGTLNGQAFDVCTAPPQSTMDAWAGGKYQAIGIYLSGAVRACAQPNLTPEWVAANAAKNWQFLLLDVGLQAPCSTVFSAAKKMSADPATARTQGRTAAGNAIAAAQALGFAQRSAIYSDIDDNYKPGTAACTAAVLSYLSGWTTELQSRGYVSGAYVNELAGGKDLSDAYNNASYSRPDNLWFARWNGVNSTASTVISATAWTNHQRVHQYQADQPETINGVTMKVDRNAVDLTAPPAALTSFTGTGAAGSATLRWTVPAGTTLGQVVVRRNVGTTPPPLPNVGTAVYAGTATSTTATGLGNATSQAFRAWVKDSSGKFGPGIDLRLTGTSSTIASSSSSIPYTGSATLYSRVTRVDTKAGVAGVPMTLYARPKNGTTFAAVATTTSSSTGSVSAVVKPTVSTVYVWGYNGSSALLGSRSAYYTVEVRPTITAYVTSAAIKLGATTSFYGYLRPQHPGTTVYLQRQSGTTWPTVGTTKLNTTGNYAFSIKPGTRGTFNYRAVWLADADHATTVSAVKTITVS
ncbi:uncharacterized protein DUF1906 [Kribbella voronezhensis]|uniref:Uncharacterized protein DUF1906 n=1 Tax=Kribbella voronezhensis TaxID=2512212 RepID=A0A4R7TCT7_9ACTN|nr:DUF1906 domain-containing protein [Kribbella voronezhensis]TDU89127.1 uncharacterized protein DUF1906 [Kribbella voronezhensis]